MSGTLFIVNPISGNGRKSRITENLRSRGDKVVLTEYAGHAEILARDASEDIIVAVGGDGTVCEVARGLYHRASSVRRESFSSELKLGLIPCGSGDGLARSLSISRNFEKALETIKAGQTQKLDCGEIDGRMFFSVCGVGLDAMVAKSFAESFAKSGSRGLINYIKVALKIWRNFKPEKYKVTIDGKVYDFTAAFVTVANSRQWGNGAQIAPHSNCGDGVLNISIIDMFRSIEIPGLVLKLMTGRIDHSRHYTGLKGRNITIERPKCGPAHFDGDFFDAGTKLEIKLLDGQLNVIRP